MADPGIKIDSDALIDDAKNNPRQTIAAPMPQAGQAYMITPVGQPTSYPVAGEMPTNQAAAQAMRAGQAAPAKTNWGGGARSQATSQVKNVARSAFNNAVTGSGVEGAAKEAVEGFSQKIMDKGMALIPPGPWKAAAVGIGGFVIVPAFKEFPILLIICLLQLGCCCCSILSGGWVLKLVLALLGLLFSCAARVVCSKNKKLFKILRIAAWIMVIVGFFISAISSIISLIAGGGKK